MTKRVLLLAALLLVFALQRPAAQSHQRLQLHGELEVNAETDGWWAVKVQAVCDTGNGTMIYMVRGQKEDTVRFRLLPNGCQKAQAER